MRSLRSAPPPPAPLAVLRRSLGAGHELECRRDECVKVREILKLLRDDGWYRVHTVGSHRQFKHPTKPGRVTVHGKPSHDLAPGTLHNILKQAQLTKPR